MKMLFWTSLILVTIWWLMKKNLGAGNDLTAHVQEENALRSIGDTALGANQIASSNFPLTTIGSSPLAGVNIDPFNPNNPFTMPNPVTLLQASPTAVPPYSPFAA
jgi:hypothetical protein